VSQIQPENIEAIEAGYEFLLAYAAQGRDSDDGPGGGEVRKTLTSMHSATGQIIDALASADSGFDTVVVDDARKSLAALDLVLGQPSISSELIDNLNASIHLRALLTDLFLVSEATN
jgi:hypothetical protein